MTIAIVIIAIVLAILIYSIVDSINLSKISRDAELEKYRHAAEKETKRLQEDYDRQLKKARSELESHLKSNYEQNEKRLYNAWMEYEQQQQQEYELKKKQLSEEYQKKEQSLKEELKLKYEQKEKHLYNTWMQYNQQQEQEYQEKYQSKINECEQFKIELEERQSYLDAREAKLREYADNVNKRSDIVSKRELFLLNKISDFEKMIEKQCQYYPALAAVMADILTAHYDEAADFLVKKKRPATKEAMRIYDLKKETRSILEEKKLLEYQLSYIQKLYPEINNTLDDGYQEDVTNSAILEHDETIPSEKLYLSDNEYKALSRTERLELALQRYIERRKSKWQIGRDYEMYIGYLLEQDNYAVTYSGITKKLEDMGRDLVAVRDEKMYIIQCKNWSSEKTIHEKHIFQLYGTVILAQIENPDYNIQGVFVTSTALSDLAKEIAIRLNIICRENVAMQQFPRIKCNINNGKKIFHLPFDQQYDSTVIEKENGEFYAFTVKEAEAQGYRHAMRHNCTEQQ